MTQPPVSDFPPFLILAVQAPDGRTLCLNCASPEDRGKGRPVLARRRPAAATTIPVKEGPR